MNKKVFVKAMAVILVLAMFGGIITGMGYFEQKAFAVSGFKVTFDKNGGDTEATPTTKYGDFNFGVTTLPTPPTRAGYVFTEWNTESDGSGSVFAAYTAVTQAITVYAQWENPAPALTVNVGPGTAVDSTKATVTDAVYGNFVVNITDSSIAIPNIGDNGPTTGDYLISGYTAGEDITEGVAAAKYLQVYDVDGNGNIAMFYQKQLAAGDIKVGAPSVLPTNGYFTDLDANAGKIGGTLTWTAASPTTGITGYKIYWGSNATTKLAGNDTVLYTAAGAASISQVVAEDTGLPDGASHFLIYSYNTGGESENCLAVSIADIAPPSGDGTEESPYLIQSVEDLLWMSLANEINEGFELKYFKQTADIDMSSIENFTPIGDSITSFGGNYNGNGYTVSKLTVDTDTGYAGLFGEIDEEGVVGSLKLEDISIMAKATNDEPVYAGGITGRNFGEIMDCHVKVSVGGESIITALGEDTYGGGITGDNTGTISECSNAARVEVGGSPDDNGSYTAGGIVGFNLNIINNCFNTGSIKNTDSTAEMIRLGGISGANFISPNGLLKGQTNLCYSTGEISLDGSGQGHFKAGIVALAFDATGIADNFYLDTTADYGFLFVDLTTHQVAPSTVGAAPKTEAELKTVSTFAGWDTDKWIITDRSLPMLKSLAPKPEPVNSGDSRGSSSTPSNNVTITVGDQTQQQVATFSTQTQNGRTVSTVTFDAQKMTGIINSSDTGSKVTVPLNNSVAAVVIGQFSGELVKAMENKELIVEIKTGNATYTLPTQQINIEAVSTLLGQGAKLSDIKVNIEIAETPDEMVKVVETSAVNGNLAIVVPPLDFSVKATYGDTTVEISQFNAYVERSIAIPDGVDPSKITTAIVVEPDGTVRHVPTKVILVDGKYFAQINSLTNSTYTVIWHPVEFKDVANHWAKEAINDMGSRMVISGVGNDMFDPARDVTRAEFAAMLVRALGLKTGTGSNLFTDVSDNSWYCDYVKTATENKIISGYGNEKFQPMDKITREQAMSMIARAMTITGLKTEFITGETDRIIAGFADADKLADYAKNGIATCIRAGVVTGRTGNLIAPKDNITRAEAAVIVKRLLEKSHLI